MQLYSHSRTQISPRPRPVHSRFRSSPTDLPVTDPPVTIQDTGRGRVQDGGDADAGARQTAHSAHRAAQQHMRRLWVCKCAGV